MLTVAILGANGFIGSRAVELWHLGGVAEVRPIVRTLPSLARLSRFDLDSRVASGFDEAALCQAFQGCDVVVHAIAGDRRTILGTLEPVYAAAQKAGVRRLVYLSSASVHGQAPAPGTDETSPLSNRQPLDYNTSKVQAERLLQQLRDRGSVELVILRPGIVFGPRSFWVTSFADALLNNSAYLVNGGQGICNSIYVDNLIHAVERAMAVPTADREVFIVGDAEQVTWADLYAPIAAAMGFNLEQIPNAQGAAPKQDWTQLDWEDRIEAVLGSQASLTFLSLFPNQWRRAARAALSTLFEAKLASPWQLPTPEPAPSIPTATLEMALLQQCQYKLPNTKAVHGLGYQPPVAFEAACQKSIGWLKFVGYPIQDVESPSVSLPLPAAFSSQSI
ncbi:NAD-dependent epimerase/dehydratase family protein [Nodosilinea sp. PGN35]|uniref:NAD-dependent epimerase/dehydratase family protein n=1 Tax=Nodosilinea sp. PGN35 TaxID=3020489 RepID=UPI0023B28DEC|nr:NAD(P)-dependent oxidoreductase [Nodosilinea sp. TSF1-S3]